MANTSSIEIVNMSQESSVEEPTTPVVPFVFDASYKGDEVTQRAAQILNLTGVRGWSVVDTCDNLALVHYDDSDDMSSYGHLRGVLIDTETGAVVAPSFGYTPTAVASELTEENGFISVKDSTGAVHNFPTNETSIKRVFEGVVIRDIWYNSRRYRITHRKINPLRSRWGSSPYFLEMYRDAGAPTDEQLFDTTKPYSSTCYTFLVSHPALLVGTRQKVTRPYIVCLARFETDLKRPEDQVAPGVANFETNSDIGGSVNESFIHDPKPLSLEEANNHLKFGYYNSFESLDPRQLTGESVILYRMENGAVVDIVKVHSPSYEWRTVMRGNDANINHQFYLLLNKVYKDVNTSEAWTSLTNQLIPLPLYDINSVKELYNTNQGILTIPEGPVEQSDYSRRDERIHLLWLNYLLSLPPNVQGQALDLLTNFHNDRNALVSWIQGIEQKEKNIETTDHLPRVKGLIGSARKLARDSMRQGSNYSTKGTKMNLPTLIKSNIQNFIRKEDGKSLYTLVHRGMKGSQKPEPTTA